MTTTAHHLHGPLRTEVRAAPAARPRLRVVHGVARLRWWHARLVLGATIGAAMAGALLGVAQGYLALGPVPVGLLQAYGAGAGVGAVLGFVLGLAMSLLLGLLDRYVLPQVVPTRRVWVRYRRG